MPSLFHDGDRRVIYEVPDPPFSYVVDGAGYRIYTPDDIPSAPTTLGFTTGYLFHRFTDYRQIDEWAWEAYQKSGGAFAGNDELGNPTYDLFSLRVINNWRYVQANYPHRTLITGTLRGDLVTGEITDAARITADNVVFEVRSAAAGQVIQTGGGGGLTPELEAMIRDTHELTFSIYGNNPKQSI